MTERPPRVFTIPPGQPFVDRLAQGILAQVGGTPEALARVRVLLPTRRACRSLREAFLRLSGGRAMLLPVMTPLGDVDEDDLALETFGDGDTLDIAPAIGAMRRAALLAAYVRKLDPEAAPEQAVRLAAELARLVDQVHTEGLDLSALPALVADADLAEHWMKTVRFLAIVGETWPAVLEELRLLDPARRRDALLTARARAWAAHPPTGPVIAAGSTGTIPATAELLGVVARLPQGALVLPGLDTDAPDLVWEHLDPGHPQFGMARLLAKLGVARADVALWPGCDAKPSPRAKFVHQALVPAEATALWREAAPPPDEALAGLTRVECAGAEEEAAAIALILRGALEQEGQTCALITPDRQLARRVAVEMRRWGVTVDDSAGMPLDQTPPGAFFNLVADMAAQNFAPVALLACLKHPLAAGGQNPVKLRAQVRALELACLRGSRPGEGLAGLADRLRVFLRDERARRAFARRGFDEAQARHLLRLLDETARPLAEALRNDEADPAHLLKLHTALAEALTDTGQPEDARRLWAGDAGEVLSGFAAEAFEALAHLGTIRGEQYPALIAALMAGRPVRPRYPLHPRVSIWGLLEARLQQANVIVLGGLNEGAWPAQTEASPWMSRPMMQAFGLPSPERRIGLAAHDFVQAVCAPRVFLTRAARAGTSPQTPSRWLTRLDTLLGEGRRMKPDIAWPQWARNLSRAQDAPQPCAAPQPRPPVTARPRKLSVTQIETWVRDPYAIYARHVLDLEPLEPLDADASAADKGTIVHTVLERFLKAHMTDLGKDPEGELLTLGEHVFREELSSPGVRAFWWPRFARIATWFAALEAERRKQGARPLLIEERGETTLDGLAAPFILSAKADRMDVDGTGGLVVVDYKTGTPPSNPQVLSGLAPQLPLEAFMAQRGVWPALGQNRPLAGLMYVRLSGGHEPGMVRLVDTTEGRGSTVAETAEKAAQDAFENLTKLIHKFDNERTPYLARPRPMFESRFGDYDHLARVKEWRAGGGEDGE